MSVLPDTGYPSWVSEIAGSTVLTGAFKASATIIFEVAGVDPAALVAVTIQVMFCPMSALTNV